MSACFCGEFDRPTVAPDEFGDSLWMVTRPLAQTAMSREVTCCSPRCLVLWLEREHKPRGLGVAL